MKIKVAGNKILLDATRIMEQGHDPELSLEDAHWVIQMWKRKDSKALVKTDTSEIHVRYRHNAPEGVGVRQDGASYLFTPTELDKLQKALPKVKRLAETETIVEVLTTCVVALANGSTLHIDYTGMRKDRKERAVTPLSMYMTSRGDLGIFTYCHLREGSRVFLASRFHDARPEYGKGLTFADATKIVSNTEGANLQGIRAGRVMYDEIVEGVGGDAGTKRGLVKQWLTNYYIKFR